jgi:hypothetical protein
VNQRKEMKFGSPQRKKEEDENQKPMKGTKKPTTLY